jgi:diaminopimelate epimerase
MRDRADQPPLRFMKMHGAGNDFVVIDARDAAPPVTDGLARALGDRHRGVGFDQLAVIQAAGVDLSLTFWNADGSRSATCGNATRCIAAWEMARTGRDTLAIRTARGALAARLEDGATWVNMGVPVTRWDQIPLSEPADTDHLPLPGDPAATGMGNPHCTFFVTDAETTDLTAHGAFETHPLFPERTNVQVASVTAPDTLRVRVWERGVGPTLASGSSSCAVASAAHRRGLTGPRVAVDLDGGRLIVHLRDDGAWMTGPTAYVFDGELSPEWVEAV